MPDYDLDSADEEWLSQQQRLQLTELKFEQMMDRLEKSSGQTVVTLNEAKTLLNQDDETSISVYDYWLNKRLNMVNKQIISIVYLECLKFNMFASFCHCSNIR